jgi:predicted dehydrogenase
MGEAGTTARTDGPDGQDARPTRVAVIGTGFVADLHLAAIGRLPNAELVGVLDVDPQHAAATAQANGGIRWTAGLDELTAWPDLDACVVCTPSDTHASIGAVLASAGKHVLMEKPLAITTADAAALVDAFAERDLVLMGAHTHRFNDYAMTVKAILDTGDVGNVVFARLAMLGGWIWPGWQHWVLDPDRSGGHALHNGTHVLDLVTWWIGDRPITVYAQGRKQTAAELDIHDYESIVVRYEGGATVVCEISRGNQPRSLEYREVFVQGTHGSLSLPWDAEGSLVFDGDGTSALPGDGQKGFTRQLASWLAAIRDGQPPDVTAEDAARAVALGVAAERSLDSGQAIDVRSVLGQVPA